jgi:protein CWC15
MTTAHRPTFVPSKGSATQGGNKLYALSQQHSSKDLPGNLTLKTRREGQGTKKDVKRIDFKRDLMERENKAKQIGEGFMSNIYGDDELGCEESKYNSNYIGLFPDITSDLLALEQPNKKQRLDSVDISDIKYEKSVTHQDPEDGEVNSDIENINENIFPQDKDDEFDDSDESIDEEFDDDSEAELLREYEKIKRMRDEEKREKEKLEAERLKQETQENILTGNPLINTGYSLKKKWYEDTIFKNQSKNEQKVKKRFINDTVRSDFHRKFIAKSIQ